MPFSFGVCMTVATLAGLVGCGSSSGGSTDPAAGEGGGAGTAAAAGGAAGSSAAGGGSAGASGAGAGGAAGAAQGSCGIPADASSCVSGGMSSSCQSFWGAYTADIVKQACPAPNTFLAGPCPTAGLLAICVYSADAAKQSLGIDSSVTPAQAMALQSQCEKGQGTWCKL